MGEVLARDIWPAEVLMADGTLITRARVFLTSHRMIVWQQFGQLPRKVVDFKLAVPMDEAHVQAAAALPYPIEVTAMTNTALINAGRGGCCSNMALQALAPPCPKPVAA